MMEGSLIMLGETRELFFRVHEFVIRCDTKDFLYIYVRNPTNSVVAILKVCFLVFQFPPLLQYNDRWTNFVQVPC